LNLLFEPVDKDVTLCPASPRERDEIRRCLSKLELLHFLNRRLHAINAKRMPNWTRSKHSH